MHQTIKRGGSDGYHLHSCPSIIYTIMRLDVSINHIRLLPSRKYPGCRSAFSQCFHWLLPTFHYARCSILHMRQGVFYRQDRQEMYPGSMWACQARKESVSSQQCIVNRFLKACDRVNCNSRHPHHPQSFSCNSSGSTRLETKPQRSVWQWDAKCICILNLLYEIPLG